MERRISQNTKRRASIRDYFSLIQPKIIALLAFSAFAGFEISYTGAVSQFMAVYAVLGVLIAAVGAELFNKVLEADIDRKMERTSMRATARGKVNTKLTLAVGVVFVSAGILIGDLANWLTALMIALGANFYVLVYTELLKRTSRLNIIIGGLAGSFCVWAGMTAASNSFVSAGFLLGLLVLFWIPGHIWSLAMKYKREYIKAGVPMLTAVESTRIASLAIAISNIFMLVVAIALAEFLDMYYLFIMIVPFVVQLYLSVKLIYERAYAWKLFKFSSIFLTIAFIAVLVSVAF